MQNELSQSDHQNEERNRDLPQANSLSPPTLDHILHTVKTFEEQQMSYSFNRCTTCKERRIDITLVDGICKKCRQDKNLIKMYSAANFMDPGTVPPELQDMSVVEQQLICKIAPAIQLHMLKHGGLAAKGHCVTFPQEIDEPARIFPKLPKEIDIIKGRKKE